MKAKERRELARQVSAKHKKTVHFYASRSYENNELRKEVEKYVR